MSEYIPFEIQAQILKRLPAKTLIQFKMVSKPWKSLIESSEFMADYNVSQTGPHHLFIRYDTNDFNRSEEPKHVSVVDNDNTFPQNRFVPTAPESFKLLNETPREVGSSHGLFCFYGEYPCESGFGSYPNGISLLIVIWNPSINKSIAIDVLVHFDIFPSLIAFGVRPDTFDPMLVKINDKHDLPWRFEVFRLSTGVWTIPLSNLPRESIRFTNNQADVNGLIYWNAYDESGSLIVSFDMKSEKFTEVNIPKCLASKYFRISKLRESLGVLEYYKEAEAQKQVCAVWMMMEDGVQKSFTKLYTISTQDALLKALPGFRNCGKPIVGTRTIVDDHEEPLSLSVYEPHSRNMDSLGIYGASHSLFVSSYTETLLLLDHPDNHVCAVWMMMEDGVQKSFTKLYTISTQDALLKALPGFRYRGKPIVGTRTTVDDHEEPLSLSVYEPHTKNMDSLGIYGAPHSLFVSSYTETLLLLDHPDNHGKPVPSRLIR